MHEEYKHIGDVKDCLIEEIGELLQAWGKYYRFGPCSYHPDDMSKKPNYIQLLQEIEDVEKRLKQFRLLVESDINYEAERCDISCKQRECNEKLKND
jgi:NTP pyrophosphatase (non-canonical NTP hydrolase)